MGKTNKEENVNDSENIFLQFYSHSSSRRTESKTSHSSVRFYYENNNQFFQLLNNRPQQLVYLFFPLAKTAGESL